MSSCRQRAATHSDVICSLSQQRSEIILHFLIPFGKFPPRSPVAFPLSVPRAGVQEEADRGAAAGRAAAEAAAAGASVPGVPAAAAAGAAAAAAGQEAAVSLQRPGTQQQRQADLGPGGELHSPRNGLFFC